MSTTIHELTSYLETIAPLALQESYDNSGLITGNKSDIVKGVLITLDSIEEVIDEAIEKGCNVVVAHHPIIFTGLKKINGNSYIERVIIKAIKNDIAIYAAHTNFDNISEGVNKVIADKLSLKNTSLLLEKKFLLKRLITFCPVDKAEEVRAALFKAGAGKIGNYDECSFNTKGTGTFRALEGADPYVGEIGKQNKEHEEKIETIYPAYIESAVLKSLIEAHPYEEVAYDILPLENNFKMIGSGMIGELENAMDEKDFLDFIKKEMKATHIRYTKLTGRKVKKVAVCGGSGSLLLKEAIKRKADFFITADFKYHQFFDADASIVIADIGHYESEQFTKDLFYEVIKKKFPIFAVHLSKINTNPINYI